MIRIYKDWTIVVAVNNNNFSIVKAMSKVVNSTKINNLNRTVKTPKRFWFLPPEDPLLMGRFREGISQLIVNIKYIGRNDSSETLVPNVIGLYW